MVSIYFVGSNKFPMSSNGGGSESKSLDCWFIIGVAGMAGWLRSSSSLLIECNCVMGTQTVISGSEFDGPKIWMKRA